MSGDVQARKRKEKKRKKDEEDTVAPPPTLGNISESLADNISLHIYKESNTGGHWCARIIFFIVLAILVGLLGVVIFEHRGSTDISTPLESSQWAFIFDGWVDDSLSLTDEEPHGGEHEEVVQIEENEEKSDENAEEKIAESEASAEEEVQEEDETLIESAEQEDETLIESAEQEDEIREDESDEEQRQIFLSKEELSRELEFEDSKQEEDVLDSEENSQQNFDDNDVLEEIYSISKDENSEEETVAYEADSEFDEIVEMPMNEDEFEKFLDIPGVNEVNDDNIDPLEEVESTEPEEYVSDIDEKPEVEEIEEESTSVAMKFGVGVALVVAAHFVLVKRWNNEEQENARQSKEGTACTTEAREEIKLLSDTVKIKKGNDDKAVEESTEQIRGRRGEEEEEPEDEEEYVEEEEEEEEEVEEEEAEDIEEGEKHENNKWHQRELREHEKKEKSLKQKDEIEIGHKKMSEEEVSEEEEEEDDDYEEEEYEEEEEEEEDDDEIENFDDSELVAKLEAKYGKLQTTQDDTDKDSEPEMETRRKNLVKYKHNK